jgi:hypothetical protein
VHSRVTLTPCNQQHRAQLLRLADTQQRHSRALLFRLRKELAKSTWLHFWPSHHAQALTSCTPAVTGCLCLHSTAWIWSWLATRPNLAVAGFCPGSTCTQLLSKQQTLHDNTHSALETRLHA